MQSLVTTEKSLRLSSLFKRCLHLGQDTSVIEEALSELQTLEVEDLRGYFDQQIQLAPLLLWHLKQRQLTPLLTERFVAELTHRYQENIARNFLLERSLKRILSRFNREGIEALALKGATTFTGGFSVFRDAFVLLDIDLLVRPSDMERATENLISDGYSLTKSLAMADARKRSFLGSDSFTQIDLHSGLFWIGTGLNYFDYFQSDVWAASILDSISGYPVRVLSYEDQLCLRLVHDTLAHETVLLRNISRLYYFCAVAHFYAERIGWEYLLGRKTKNGSDRLLLAYLYFGKRELGAPLPSELERFHERASKDLAYLDAVVGSSPRLADYTHRTSLALLAADTLRERLRKATQLLMRKSIAGKQQRKNAVNRYTVIFKRFCLQLAAILYVGAYSLRHSIMGE